MIHDVKLCFASLCTNTVYCYTHVFRSLRKKAHSIFPTVKVSLNASIELVVFSILHKAKNHCLSVEIKASCECSFLYIVAFSVGNTKQRRKEDRR